MDIVIEYIIKKHSKKDTSLDTVERNKTIHPEEELAGNNDVNYLNGVSDAKNCV